MATTHVSSASELKATLASAKGGDTILVKSGSYGWVTLDNFKFNDYVTIKSADGKGGAVFKHIGLNNTSHIRLDNLTMEFGTTPLHNLKAIEVRKTDHLQVLNSEIIGHAATKDWEQLPRGIQVWDGSSDIELIDNHFHHFGRAVFFQGVKNIIIKDNLIDYIRADGIVFQNSHNVLVENNLLTNFYRQGADHADYIQFDPGTSGADSNVVIRGNVMLKGDGNGDVQGIFGGVHHLDVLKKGFANFLVENNIYFDTGLNSLQLHTGENMTVRNNTVLTDPADGRVGWIRLTGPQTNSVIENNVALQVNAEGGATASGNVIVQYRDPSKPNYYGNLFSNPFADPASLADLAPKSGTPVGYGSGKGAEKLFQELLGGADPTPANTTPVAADDTASTVQGSPVTIDVLANDADDDGDALSVASVSQAANGTVTRNADNTVSYAPAAGFTGPDSFTYTVSDGNGGTDTATVAVTVGSASAVVAAINAGGPAFPGGTAYSADVLFSGGKTYSTTAAIAGTTADALYQSERWGNFSYAVPVANGTYNVTLQFAEIYWNAAGKRVFDVTAEGNLILDNLDIFSAAGGNNIAYDVTVPVAVSDGTLNLGFITVADNAKINAIRIAASDGGGSPTNTPPVANADSNWGKEDTGGASGNVLQSMAHGGAPFGSFADVADTDADSDPLTLTQITYGTTSQPVSSSGTTAIAGAYGTLSIGADGAYSYAVDNTNSTVNALDDGQTLSDSFAYTVSDDNGGTASANLGITVFGTTDTAGGAVVAAINAGGPAFPGGTAYSADVLFSGGKTYSTTAAIAGTTADALYQSERWGNFSYAFAVANGTYEVTLQFAEIYWGAAGKRLFDVTAEGKLILDDLDIFSAAGGNNIAYDVTVPVAVSDGTLNLGFITVKDNAKISAIQIANVLGDSFDATATVALSDTLDDLADPLLA